MASSLVGDVTYDGQENTQVTSIRKRRTSDTLLPLIKSVVRHFDIAKKNNTSDEFEALEKSIIKLNSIFPVKLKTTSICFYKNIQGEKSQQNGVYTRLLMIILELSTLSRLQSHATSILSLLIEKEQILCHYIIENQYALFESLIEHASSHLDSENIALILKIVEHITFNCTIAISKRLIQNKTTPLKSFILKLAEKIAYDGQQEVKKLSAAILASILSCDNCEVYRTAIRQLLIDSLSDTTRTALYKSLVQTLSSQDISAVFEALTILSCLTLPGVSVTLQDKMTNQLGERLFNQSNSNQTLQLSFRTLLSEDQKNLEQHTFATNLIICMTDCPRTAKLLAESTQLPNYIAQAVSVISRLGSSLGLCNLIFLVSALCRNSTTRSIIISVLKRSDTNTLKSFINNMLQFATFNNADINDYERLVTVKCSILSANMLSTILEYGKDKDLNSCIGVEIQNSISNLFEATENRYQSNTHVQQLTALLTLFRNVIGCVSKTVKSKIQIRISELARTILQESSSDVQLLLSAAALLIDTDVLEEEELSAILTSPKVVQMIHTAISDQTSPKSLHAPFVMVHAMMCIQYLGNNNHLHDITGGILTQRSADTSSQPLSQPHASQTSALNMEEKNDYERQIKELKTKNQSLVQELEQLHSQHTSDVEELSRKNKKLQSDLFTSREDVRELETKQNSTQQVVKQKTDQLEDTYKKLIVLTQIYKNSLTQTTNMDRSHRELREQLEQERNNVKQVKEANAKLLTNCEQLEAWKQNTKIDLDAMTDRLKQVTDELEEEKAIHTETCNDLSEEVEELRAKLNACELKLKKATTQLQQKNDLISMINKLTNAQTDVEM